MELPRKPEVFDGRITEIVELLKGLYELQASKYWCWQKLEAWTLKTGSEKELLSVENGGIYNTLCRIAMPDATPPNRVHFTIDVANKTTGEKYTIIGSNPQTLHDLNLTTPNPFGYITIYDSTNYIYAWHEPWELNLKQGEIATVKLTNETPRDVTVQIVTVDGYARPLGRYISKEVP
jgi:hypothetical protein